MGGHLSPPFLTTFQGDGEYTIWSIMKLGLRRRCYGQLFVNQRTIKEELSHPTCVSVPV